MKMRCIFCKSQSDFSRSIEHILPESLGNVSHTLPKGVVCDDCNNYFARKVEKPVLESSFFSSLRFQQAIPNKIGKIPPQKAILNRGVIVDLVSSENSLVVRVPPEHWDKVSKMDGGELVFPTTGAEPEKKIMSRFLAKVALEAMALRLIEADYELAFIIDDVQLDPLRYWARRGYPGEEWLFSQRAIYDANHCHTNESGGEYQCLHEFDFLATDAQEMYFCMAIFGVEYTINVAGSALDGFMEWLETNNHESPLYPSKKSG